MNETKKEVDTYPVDLGISWATNHGKIIQICCHGGFASEEMSVQPTLFALTDAGMVLTYDSEKESWELLGN